MLRFLGLLGCLLASPALACTGYSPETLRNFDWGQAERFDGLTATRLMQAMLAISNLAGPLTDLRTYNVPAVDFIYALPVGEQVLIIRVRGTLLCDDDPVGRELYEEAKRWVLPAQA